MDQFTEAQKLEFGIGLSDNPVILINSFSAISWINDFAIKNTGFTKKDCIGLPIQQFIQKLGSDKALDISELFSSKRSFDFEIESTWLSFHSHAAQFLRKINPLPDTV